MKNIKVFTTGGTISSSPDNKGLLKTGSISGTELVEKCDLEEDINLDVEEVFSFPSNHMDFDSLIILKNRIIEAFSNDYIDGVVITHGTDTLEETAFFLDLAIDSSKPVVVTGSQRSMADIGSDAAVNLGQAIKVAADSMSHNMGTLVLFNEQIHSAREVTKVHASNVMGFSSLGYGYLGVVDKEDVILYRKPCLRKKYSVSRLSQVDLISCSLGSDGKFIDSSIASKTKGIVLDGFGRGHVPPDVMPKVEEAAKEGLVVVITSQTLEGRVYPVYNFTGSNDDLLSKGVIPGGSLSGRKARIKLAILLSVYGSNRERISKEFKEV